jgi:probable HAF family extracellular repeat protein
MRHGISSVLALAMLALIGSAVLPQRVRAADYAFVPINFPGTVNATSAFGVNNAGAVVGNYLNPNTGIVDGFVYSNGNYTDVAPNGGMNTTLNAINSAGAAVGYYQGSDTNYHAFTYANGTFNYLSDFPVSGVTFTGAEGINSTGTIVGFYSTSQPVGTFYPTSSGFELQGVVYTAYNYPGAAATIFNGINDAGTIVGNYFDASGNSHGFFLPNGGSPISVNYPNEPSTEANAINNLGQIVGFYQDASGLQHGFIYSGGINGTYTTLDFPNDPGLSPIFPGSTGTELFGINDLGQIAGTYNNYSNGFLADPVFPEPGSLSLFAVGILSFGVYRWRRWKTAR